MIVHDISFEHPLDNLNFDDELLLRAERGEAGESLRLWESPTFFVVLGRTGDEDIEVDGEAACRDGVSIIRRSSGGGSVVQGPGCLNFSLVLSKALRPELRPIAQSYRLILDRLIRGLSSLGVAAEFRPVCDLVTTDCEKKFSGNAQRRGRGYILHHGTILYQFNLKYISRYLKMPPRMPEYRRGRPHEDFVTNVAVSSSALKQVMIEQWLAGVCVSK